jgi:HlyD family secretion protein
MKKISFLLAVTAILINACNNNNESDAYGNFSATEILLSSEASGTIIKKNMSEGEVVDSAALAYIIDTVQNHLKKKELYARRKSIIAKKANIAAQIAVLEEQKKAVQEDLQRVEKMLQDGAASEKQKDDLKNKLQVIEKQIAQVRTNNSGINAEVAALEANIDQVEDAIQRAMVRVPVAGTILNTYAEIGETVAMGKPLLKMANLDKMELKAYFSGDQLPLLKIGDKVDVLTDDGTGGFQKLEGRISSISSNAEFTPKIIQTRKERVNLVYAVKISVKNNGTLKINMPGEVKLISEN